MDLGLVGGGLGGRDARREVDHTVVGLVGGGAHFGRLLAKQLVLLLALRSLCAQVDARVFGDLLVPGGVSKIPLPFSSLVFRWHEIQQHVVCIVRAQHHLSTSGKVLKGEGF